MVGLERKYEILYIVRPDLDGGHEEVTNAYTSYIGELGGTIVQVDDWGSKKFAYEIQNFDSGNYVLVTFSIESEQLSELEGRLKLDDRVLRYQIVRLEEEKVGSASASSG